MNNSSDKLTLNYLYQQANGIYFPIIPIKFIYLDKETNIVPGIIDTGSDDILIKNGIAKRLGINMTNWFESKSASGKFRKGKVKVDFYIIHDKGEELFNNVEITVNENDEFPPLPLIGRYPLFERYNIVFNNSKNRCSLIPK